MPVTINFLYSLTENAYMVDSRKVFHIKRSFPKSSLWINYDMIHCFEALKHTGWRHLLVTAANVTTLRPQIHEAFYEPRADV